MPVLYPYSMCNLSGAGQIPSDGIPVRAVHFNRLFREVSAIQSALGPGDRLMGNLADFDTRISGEMNQDGSLRRELITDDDPSGNERGCYRYFDAQKEDTQISRPTIPIGDLVFVPMAYSAWDEPPAFLFSYGDDLGSWVSDAARILILAVSEVGVTLNFRRHDGSDVGVDLREGELHWFAVSRTFKVWDEDKAWAHRPIRTGS